MTATQQQSSDRTLELVHTQHEVAKGTGRFKKKGEGDGLDADFLQFVLGELETMQQKVGELRFAIAAMTTLIRDKLQHH